MSGSPEYGSDAVVALQSATILPFPERRTAAQAEPGDRLARALESLNAAMSEQKAALAAWRGSLASLQASTQGLGDSLHRYKDALGTLSGNVNTLHTQAVSLERWADGVLSK